MTMMTHPDDDISRRTKTIGTVMDNVEAMIVDKDGKVLQRGQPGTMMTRG